MERSGGDVKRDESSILAVLDACCDDFTFPMLDNGYIYLAATRLALFRSPEDWALVIEVFGFSPRAGLPDLCVYTFSSSIHARPPRDAKFVTEQAHPQYLKNHPHDESSYFHPIDEGDWRDNHREEFVSLEATDLKLRGREVPLPKLRAYAEHGIELENPEHDRVFELCRYLAATQRADILATESEQRVRVRPEMTKLLQLDDWHHPDVVDGESRPSNTESFQQLARVPVTGDVSLYAPTLAPNTHWKNWPDGGSL